MKVNELLLNKAVEYYGLSKRNQTKLVGLINDTIITKGTLGDDVTEILETSKFFNDYTNCYMKNKNVNLMYAYDKYIELLEEANELKEVRYNEDQIEKEEAWLKAEYNKLQATGKLSNSIEAIAMNIR
jgi:hypothetical protein